VVAPRLRPESLDLDEVRDFVADLGTARDRAVALVMLLGGLRAGEVRSLRLAAVDFGLRRLRLSGTGGRERVVVPVAAAFFTELATAGTCPGCRPRCGRTPRRLHHSGVLRGAARADRGAGDERGRAAQPLRPHPGRAGPDPMGAEDPPNHGCGPPCCVS
jgi:integrase